MARPRNPDGTTLSGFPGGVNNVAPEHDAPKDEFGRTTSLREAVNVDLVGPNKKARLREGRTKLVAGKFHSPHDFGSSVLVVRNGDLERFSLQGTSLGVVRAGVGTRRISYADVHGDLYWSNGEVIRCLRNGEATDLPAWINSTGSPRAEALAEGGLEPGDYRVALTWLDADGRESGAVGVEIVTVQAGGGIRVFDIPPAPETAAQFRLYMSAQNGNELYFAGNYLPLVTQTTLGVAHLRGGKELRTLWLQPMPPCDILRFWNGRLLGAAANLLVWSEPTRIGLIDNDSYMRVGTRISLLEPVGHAEAGGGVWLADHKNTYWLEGSAPDKWRRRIKSDSSAVPGTSMIVDAGDVGLDVDARVAVWMSTDGVFTAGLPTGELVDLTRDRLALPEGYSGAALLRERHGMRQLIMSYLGSNPNQLSIGDRASATVTRHST